MLEGLAPNSAAGRLMFLTDERSDRSFCNPLIESFEAGELA